ncbi:uncharacterized protein LOC132555464 [Ylistrum balloti]|uniref:uncharacterized protein LOC132555464 n=1 Tax=Ylistrum balloti TaxID=509963 RepID=UPI002905CDC5|nr:uncharacterized protein LOC132555464 [Ylistrum balloti]
MVNVCVVYDCHNRSSQGVVKRSFHAIPAIITTQGKPLDLYNQSHPDWAPSLKLGLARSGEEKANTCSPTSLERYSRALERQHKRIKYSAAETLLELADPVLTASPSDVTIPCSTSKTYTFRLMGKLDPRSTDQQTEGPSVDQIREDHQNLTTENLDLRKKLQEQDITPESLKDKDEKVKYFTGLPGYLSLMALFNFLDPHISGNGRNILTNFQKLFLVLMKLRLDLSVQDLAYRFGVSASTVSRTFNRVIHIMYVRMKDLIMWPDREQLRSTMPMEFRKNFGLKVAVIIDCFEIFIERPSNLLARAETWSNYKHHNTIKFLIGVTPQGVVSFLSPGWGGRTSDKQITENCDLLQHLLPGDLVLADRGFDIAESVGLKCAEVKIPAFTKGKKQLSALEVEQTRKIAHVRIHVERVIGLVRNKYTILKGTLPIDYLQSDHEEVPLVDKIVTVCCALTNLCDSVVPFN